MTHVAPIPPLTAREREDLFAQYGPNAPTEEETPMSDFQRPSRISTVNLTIDIETPAGVPADVTAASIAALVASEVGKAIRGNARIVGQQVRVDAKVSSAFIVRTEPPQATTGDPADLVAVRVQFIPDGWSEPEWQREYVDETAYDHDLQAIIDRPGREVLAVVRDDNMAPLYTNPRW